MIPSFSSAICSSLLDPCVLFSEKIPLALPRCIGGGGGCRGGGGGCFGRYGEARLDSLKASDCGAGSSCDEYRRRWSSMEYEPLRLKFESFLLKFESRLPIAVSFLPLSDSSLLKPESFHLEPGSLRLKTNSFPPKSEIFFLDPDSPLQKLRPLRNPPSPDVCPRSTRFDGG